MLQVLPLPFCYCDADGVVACWKHRHAELEQGLKLVLRFHADPSNNRQASRLIPCHSECRMSVSPGRKTLRGLVVGLSDALDKEAGARSGRGLCETASPPKMPKEDRGLRTGPIPPRTAN